MLKQPEEILVQQLRLGSSMAFEQLHHQYHRALFNVIFQVVKDPIEAQDILQDAFVKIWQRFDNYDPQRGRLYTWMASLTRRMAIDFVRTTRPIFISLEPGALPAEPAYWLSTNGISVKHLVRQVLTPDQWQLIELAYWQGYTYEEVADRLDIPLGTVKSRIRKSLFLLRPLFDIEYRLSA